MQCQRRSAAWILAVAVSLFLTSDARAQYFGNNKVQYKHFDIHCFF